MSGSLENAEQLHALLAAMVDGRLTPAGRDELETRLLDSPAAQTLYVDFVALHTELNRLHRGLGPQGEFDPPEQGVGLASLTDLTIDGAEPIAATATSWTSRLASRVDWNRHPGYFLACAVLLTLGGWVLFAALTVPDGKASNRRSFAAADHAIARVVWGDQAVWKGFDPRGRGIPAGQQLVLRSGLAELHYETGAIVILAGPAEFTVGGKDQGGRRKDPKSDIPPSNSGYLALGKLLARVKGPQAKGFTIEMPGARVEDLGTEFAVQVQSDGAAEVVVLTGAVDVVREAAGNRPAKRMRLTRDQGASIAASGRTIARRGKADTGFVAAMRSRLPHQDDAMPIVSDLDSGLAVGRFGSGTARIINHPNGKCGIVGAPASLVGLTAIVPPRGKGGGQPGAGYRFRVNESARLYLLVHNRGDHSPDGWQRTDDAVTWTIKGQTYTYTDTVYTRRVEPGEVNIPPHDGRNEKSNYGVPHACLVAPSAEDPGTVTER